MFQYFKIPYFTCTFFTKFTYNEYIGPYFLSHVVLRSSPVNSPRMLHREQAQWGVYGGQDFQAGTKIFLLAKVAQEPARTAPEHGNPNSTPFLLTS
jgi:hypothetical protein